ncbi:MAG: peptide transporter ptr2 [Chaenotheca gracillima]|nr:MAG: peptide transporter ptr2 [Chaenotheca gracillima]
MAPRKPYTVIYLSSDGEASDYEDDFNITPRARRIAARQAVARPQNGSASRDKRICLPDRSLGNQQQFHMRSSDESGRKTLRGDQDPNEVENHEYTVEAADADDEGDEVNIFTSAVTKRRPPEERTAGPTPQRSVREMDDRLRHMPSGRMWLHHIEVPSSKPKTSEIISVPKPLKLQPFLSQQPTRSADISASMARSKTKSSPVSNRTRQAPISSFFGIVDRGHPATTPSRMAPRRHPELSASGTRPASKVRDPAPIIMISSDSETFSAASDHHDSASEDGSVFHVESESDDAKPPSTVDGSLGEVKDFGDSAPATEDSASDVPPPKRAKRQRKLKWGGELDSPSDISDGVVSKTKKKTKSSGRSNDSWTFKAGPKWDLPPLHDIEDIFIDMTANAVNQGLKSAVDHLANRKLRIATMCSGTESPILALDLIAESLKKHHGISLKFEHCFSAEIVPYKQAYIDRNFSPPVIFRDVREMVHGDEATSAYGAKVAVPGNVDVLVAGWSCVDFSLLNHSKQQLDDPGESGDTFRAVLNYAKKWRPTLIVLENVCTAPWEKIQKIWDEDGNYHAQFLRLDSKEYYIPQTRQRGYMVCIAKERLKSSGNPAEKWVNVMKALKRPASSSIEAFLLPEDDPRVHRAREDLLKSSRGEEKPPREVDWTTCQGRHQDYRNDLALGWKRSLTQWEDNGSCRMPDYAWADWAQGMVERIWDTIDISNNRNARRGFDCQYKTRYWDLSQNIDRFQDSTAFGIAGCITPSGLPYITYRGGPMIGQESLALQGIPIDKILLTRESQRQLQDLAGNAMTSTVAGAGVLAALIVGHRALRRGTGYVEEESVEDVDSHLCGEARLVATRTDISKQESASVNSILERAQQTLQLCHCEGPLMQTLRELQRCRDCRHTTCVKCGGIPAHNYEIIPREQLKGRMNPATFEDWLKGVLPMRVDIKNITLEDFERIKDSRGIDVDKSTWKIFRSNLSNALGMELRFYSVKRSRLWTVTYESPASRMELIVTPEQAEWRLYAKVKKTEPGNSPARELFSRPFARMRPKGDSLTEGIWELCIPSIHRFSVEIKGQGTTIPSWEAGLGLQEANFADSQVWTSLHVSAAPADMVRLDMDISGDYDLLPNCGMASVSLHKKRADSSDTPLYLFLDPTRLGDPLYDPFVFSTDIRRLNYGEGRATVAQLDYHWRPPRLPTKDREMIKTDCFVQGLWAEHPKAVLKPVASDDATRLKTAPPNLLVSITEDSCKSANTILSCQIQLPENEVRDEKLRLKDGEWSEIDKPSERRVLSAYAWLTERVRKIPGLEKWKELNLEEDSSRCTLCAPEAPRMKWGFQKQKISPHEDPKEAGPYERALKNRPAPFVTQIRIDEDKTQYLRIGLNVTTLAHRALSKLRGAYHMPMVAWRLDTNFISSAKISLPKLTLPSNKLDRPAKQPPYIRLPLRPEQLRSLHWMMEQEDASPPSFIEEEVEEALLPQLGWRAESRATRFVSIRGGVLADQVGYGKTATTLGLIASQQDRLWPSSNTPGKIPLKATLIVVPSQLTKQWNSEIFRFFGKHFNVLVITALRQLTTMSIRDFQRADIIIVNWNLFSNDTYLTKVADFAAIPEMPSSEGRAFDAWFEFAEKRVAEHVDMLLSHNAQDLHGVLQAELASFEANSMLSECVPSKRLRGAAYRAAQGKGGSGPAKVTKDGRKRSRDELEDDDDDESARGQTQDSGQAQRLRKDPFNLRKAARDWTLMQSPVFQMFKFQRLVVDEYTYAKDKNHTAITHISADLRWVLSGTPPLGDFADVKTIAVFLGINLGIDDDAPGVLRSSNAKKMQRDRTAAETFRAFKDIRSPAWHTNRHAVAQRFLDQFVRQNIAEIDEIPFTEELRPVFLSAAERAIYIELHQHLLSQDMRIRRGKSKSQSDRERRLMEMIGESKTPEEALIKKCSHFHLEDFEVDRHNPTQACDLIVTKRQKQFDDLIKEIRRELKCGVWLKRHCVLDGEDKDTHFQNWLGNVKQNVNGDLEVTAALAEIIDLTNKEYSKGDWKRFYHPAPKSDSIAKPKPVKKKQPKKKLASRKSRKLAESDSGVFTDESDPDEMEIDESENDLPLLPATVDDKVKKLRLLTVHLRRLTTELVLRQRSLRFMRLVRQLQRFRALGEANMIGHCSKCNKAQESSDSLDVFIVCGHSVCKSCRENYQVSSHCIVKGCNASVVEHQVVRANELDGVDQGSQSVENMGGKLEAVINLIKFEIDTDDQVLLFVQFDDLMDKVSYALDINKISHQVMRAKSRKAENVISDFQTETGKDKRKVLILNVADESAAGANLTNANHVIFLSPLLADTQYQYDSSMAQAVGRARRYGQRKVVHVYQFLSLKTIDVDILEQRSSKRLIQNADGDFELKIVKHSDFEETEAWGAGRVRRQHQFDSE